MKPDNRAIFLQDTEKITIALIATYPEMSRILKELLQGTNIELIDIYASFENAAEAAKEIENHVDAILTRGGTGHFVKQAVSIPVVSVPIAPFDLTISVSALPPEIKKVAFTNYQRAIFGTEQIGQLFGKQILQYQFTNREDLMQAAAQAKADGCDVFIGGAEGCVYARSIGLRGVEVVSGPEAIFQSLSEAIEIIRAKREEKKQTARLKAAFDSLAEGICVLDQAGKIQVFNPSIAHMFQTNEREAVGRDIHEVTTSQQMLDAFDNRQAHLNTIQQVWNITANTNHIPIYMDGNFIGVVSTYQDITKIQRLEGQIRQQLSQKHFKAKYCFDDILTLNPNMETLKEIARLYARTDSAVLIEGESGTGKELFAHSIHSASLRASGPFVAVNCAAIPEQLLESELFGYAPGAFTGARKEGKKGLFELAHNGTIFLDEIGEMPKYLQSRLLRVLQEKEIMRVGDSKIISVNCRILSATNKDLAALVGKGEFREDLYYRLNIFNIKVPPLRERAEDIPLLCEHFLAAAGAPLESVSFQAGIRDQIQQMKKRLWPGNIRELSNACARIALLYAIQQNAEVKQYLKAALGAVSAEESSKVILRIGEGAGLKEAMDEAERQYITAVLEKNNHNQSATAKQLGIGRTTLWRKLNVAEDAPAESME